MTHTVLRIDASAKTKASVTRKLTDQIIDQIAPNQVFVHDLAQSPLPQITEAWVGANFTKESDRSNEQKEVLAQSDQLIAELQAADTIVIGAPMYNFSIPAALKAWIDLVARAGLTFRYTENGPEGLVHGKRAIIALASGGVPSGAPMDYVGPYMTHVLGFLGITDVTIIAADQMNADADAGLARAQAAITQMPKDA